MEANKISYTVVVPKKVEKSLEKLPKSSRLRIKAALRFLEVEPRPSGVKKLKDVKPDTYRVRIGDYRILYHIFDEILVIEVIEIAPRKDVY